MAALSGGYHYKLEGDSWLGTKGEGELFDNLTRCASEQSGLTLDFRRP